MAYVVLLLKRYTVNHLSFFFIIIFLLTLLKSFKVEASAEVRSQIMQVRAKLQTLRVLMKQSKYVILKYIKY